MAANIDTRILVTDSAGMGRYMQLRTYADRMTITDEATSQVMTIALTTSVAGANTGDQTAETVPLGTTWGLSATTVADGLEELSGEVGSLGGRTYLIREPDPLLPSATVMGDLATGILRNTTTTGVPVIAVPADFPTLNQNTTGTAAKADNLTGGNGTTLLGAIPYQSASDDTSLLSPNTTTTKKFLQQTGTGTNGAAPAWGGILGSDIVYTGKIGFSPEGGMAVKFTNKTGAASVKGTVVTVYSATAIDNAVSKTINDIPTAIGVIYEDGVADGAEVWVVTSGIADVYFGGSTARGNLARTTVTGDAFTTSGYAISEAAPTAPFATDKHFCEIGHVLESRTGAGLAKVNLHFN